MGAARALTIVRPRGRLISLKGIKNPVDQAKYVFRAGNHFAALCGMVLGGFVPVASFTLAHAEVARHPELWILVAGGLAYSAISVYQWAERAFKYKAKAAGFVLLTGGVLAFSHTQALSAAALVLLVLLNGITATLALQKTEAV